MSKQRALAISNDLALPLNAVTSTTVVYGGKGMGKTNLGGVMVEELSAAGLRWSVLDPMGVWWGLRYAADGRGKGIECLILGGAHGDIPVEPTGGAVVADLVADERVNVIIDISRKANGEMWSIAERIRFVRDYGKQLFRRQGSLVDGKRREPICQVIDEAARFLPQKISAGEEEVAQCMSIWRAIVEEGRNVGIGVVLMTQRSARLNKDVAELADLMLAFRTIGPNSLNAVLDWLGEHVDKKELQALSAQVRTLPVGSCLAVSPGWLAVEKVIAIRKRNTFDSSATPKAGESTVRVRGEGAKPDLQVFAQRMAETIERAKQDSVPELRKRIRELEVAAAKTPAPVTVSKPVADPALVKANDDLKRENAELKRELAGKLANFEQLRTDWEALEKAVAKVTPFVAKLNMGPLPIVPAPSAKALPEAAKPQPEPALAQKVQAAEPVPASDRKLGGVALKIAAIAAAYTLKGKGINKKLLATLCGSTIGGTFSARISDARTAGVVVTDGPLVQATPEGIEQYGGAWHVPETTDEVLALWRPRLGGVALQILDHLVSLGGESISRAELADAVGAKIGGTFSARLSDVRGTQLLVEQGTQVAVNRELLFLP